MMPADVPAPWWPGITAAQVRVYCTAYRADRWWWIHTYPTGEQARVRVMWNRACP
jgi:hypothetical protein